MLLVAGAAYFVWEHGQGKHGQARVACPLCWLNKVSPPPEPPAGPSPAEPPDQA